MEFRLGYTAPPRELSWHRFLKPWAAKSQDCKASAAGEVPLFDRLTSYKLFTRKEPHHIFDIASEDSIFKHGKVRKNCAIRCLQISLC
jgi:hypothetical protein